jgi:hypothetical protein
MADRPRGSATALPLHLALANELVCLFIVAFIGFVGFEVRADPAEPVVGGHTLSYWLEHYTTRANETDRRLADQAAPAIRAMGSNALPALLVWLRYEPSQTKTEVMEFLKRIRRTAYGRWIPPELTYENGPPPAHVGFYILGPLAAPAIPELAAMANDAARPRVASRALQALISIGPPALPAVEAQLANTNFALPLRPANMARANLPRTLPAYAAVNMYLHTRTGTNYNQLSSAEAKPILLELRTNANPLLAAGAVELLQKIELPSRYQRGKNKTLSEALLDIRTEGEMGAHLKPGWNVPEKLSPEEERAAAAAVEAAKTAPTHSHGDEPYPYPLQPGTAGWKYATAEERVASVEIPKSWREHATSWQLFRSAIGNPYFRGISPLLGSDIGTSYRASRMQTVSILQDVDTAPDFGTNVLRWLTELDIDKMAAAECSQVPSYVPCWSDYLVVCYMATLNSALDTMDVSSRQRLFRLAVWDTDYFLSRSNNFSAGAPLEIIYALGSKPETFRGPLPPAAILTRLSATQGSPLTFPLGGHLQENKLRSSVATAKAALGLKERPRQ